MSRVSILLFVAAVFLFAPPAKAGCWDYVDLGDQACSGDGGCQGTFPVVFCTFGCVSGTCNNEGNGGFCCGQQFSYAQIFPDGQGSCHGNECGGGIGRRQPRLRHKKADALARLKVDPDAVLLTYRPPRMVFVPNSCDHVYSVLLEDYSPITSARGN